MGNGKRTYQSNIEENIKQYCLEDLVNREKVREVFLLPAQEFGMELCITCRHGEEFLATPKYQGYEADVISQPGDKLRVQNRTVGHVYADFSQVDTPYAQTVQNWYRAMLSLLGDWLQETYLRKEAENYISESAVVTAGEKYQEKLDSLTGVYSKAYFMSRLKVIERSEVVPVALIQGNINDTKFFFDTYGEEEGSRLLRIVADAMKQCAKKEYIIGRCGVDVFCVLIPLPEEGEAEKYCDMVKAAVCACEDDILAPSVAMGVVYKTNVEENFLEKLSDVEFEMLGDKMRMKQQPGYEERKNKGLKRQ